MKKLSRASKHNEEIEEASERYYNEVIAPKLADEADMLLDEFEDRLFELQARAQEYGTLVEPTDGGMAKWKKFFPDAKPASKEAQNRYLMNPWFWAFGAHFKPLHAYENFNACGPDD